MIKVVSVLMYGVLGLRLKYNFITIGCHLISSISHFKDMVANWLP